MVIHDATANLPVICGPFFFPGPNELYFDVGISQTKVGCRASHNDFVFDTPLVGFGGEFESAISGDILLVTVDGMIIDLSTVFTTGPVNGFFNIIASMSPIASIHFPDKNSGNYGHFGIDNLQLALYTHGSVQDTSGLGILAIRALSIAGLGFLRRRKSA